MSRYGESTNFHVSVADDDILTVDVSVQFAVPDDAWREQPRVVREGYLTCLRNIARVVQERLDRFNQGECLPDCECGEFADHAGYCPARCRP